MRAVREMLLQLQGKYDSSNTPKKKNCVSLRSTQRKRCRNSTPIHGETQGRQEESKEEQLQKLAADTTCDGERLNVSPLRLGKRQKCPPTTGRDREPKNGPTGIRSPESNKGAEQAHGGKRALPTNGPTLKPLMLGQNSLETDHGLKYNT